MGKRFIVDWQAAGEQPLGSSVSLSLQGHTAGLFRIKQVHPEGLLLSHGAVSFPVGTQLDIDRVIDIEGQERKIPVAQHSAKVVANDPQGLSLAWSTHTRFIGSQGR